MVYINATNGLLGINHYNCFFDSSGDLTILSRDIRIFVFNNEHISGSEQPAVSMHHKSSIFKKYVFIRFFDKCIEWI